MGIRKIERVWIEAGPSPVTSIFGMVRSDYVYVHGFCPECDGMEIRRCHLGFLNYRRPGRGSRRTETNSSVCLFASPDCVLVHAN